MAPYQDSSDPIMERFIPALSSQGLYRAVHSDFEEPNPGNHSPKRLAGHGIVRDDSILDLSRTSIDEGSTALSPSPFYDAPFHNSNKGVYVTHRDAIAEALNFHNQSRVFKFSPKSSSNGVSRTPSSSSIFSYNDGILQSRKSMSESSEISSSSLSNLRVPQKRLKSNPIKNHISYRILAAEGLRNDFYSDLISWSKATSRVAVGLGAFVYIWSERDGAVSLNLPELETISCISFSNSDLILIATKTGRLSLFSQESLTLLSEFFNVGQGSGTCCITWFPGSDTKFAVGVERGEVFIFEVVDGCSIVLVTQFRANQQQVCGIAIAFDSKQMSIGGNDNCCTIWNIEDLSKPELKYFLPHQAAVKAIAYCPWSTAILATGGGSRDRTIRFWHTNSGTLLDSLKTSGQITSLIWSECKKQIDATFGFTGTKMISVYSYPKMEEIVQVEGSPDSRVLSAVTSPDSTSICVASNDETVRFYELWDPKDNKILKTQENGLFGSDLIELSEGISIPGGTIR